MKNKIKTDTQRWKNLKTYQGRITTVKTNILPHLNLLFFMLPLCPHPNYFNYIHCIVSKFIWDGRRPRIHLITMQWPKLLGGLALPNFELYYWSFQIRVLSTWINLWSTTAWKMIESARLYHTGCKTFCSLV